MVMRALLAISVAILSLSPLLAAPPKFPNVILLTLDGVRYREFFGTPDPALGPGDAKKVFSRFWENTAQTGLVLGSREAGSPFEASNWLLVSLPAYHAIMAGANTPCRNNRCGRIRVESLPERLTREMGLKKGEAAVFASWSKIGEAAERLQGILEMDAGPSGKDPAMTPEAREDAATWDKAIFYLRSRQPRFLWIALNDSDEWGHRDNYSRYLASLRQYDQWIAELAAAIEAMPEYGPNTLLIITTDHGRGEGAAWKDHGIMTPQARAIWLFARGPETPRRGIHQGQGKTYTHLNIRATIEAWMGLAPCAGCAGPITEVFSPSGPSSPPPSPRVSPLPTCRSKRHALQASSPSWDF